MIDLSQRILIGIDRTVDKLTFLDGQVAFGQPINCLNPVQTGRPTSDIPVGDSHYEYESVGLYVQDEIAWDRWRLLLGGRYEEVEIYAFTADFIDPAVTRTDNPFSPRLGLTFLATPDPSMKAGAVLSQRGRCRPAGKRPDAKTDTRRSI